MKVIRFAIGFAAGYVLGARAGREKYEQIVAAVNRALDPSAKAVLTSGTDEAPASKPARHSVPEADVPTDDVPASPKPRSTQATVTAPSVTPET